MLGTLGSFGCLVLQIKSSDLLIQGKCLATEFHDQFQGNQHSLLASTQSPSMVREHRQTFRINTHTHKTIIYKRKEELVRWQVKKPGSYTLGPGNMEPHLVRMVRLEMTIQLSWDTQERCVHWSVHPGEELMCEHNCVRLACMIQAD